MNNVKSDKNLINIKKIKYSGWKNCYFLSNRLIELIVTTDIGPRIIKFGFVNERNEFREVPEHAGLTGGQQWRSYGGHRLWHSPEDKIRTYVADNYPISSCFVENKYFRLSQLIENLTGVQKEFDIKLSEVEYTPIFISI